MLTESVHEDSKKDNNLPFRQNRVHRCTHEETQRAESSISLKGHKKTADFAVSETVMSFQIAQIEYHLKKEPGTEKPICWKL